MNSSNLGVGALTLANIAIVEEAAKNAGITPKFLILGWSDPNPNYLKMDNVEIVGLRLKDFIKPVGGLYSHLRTCDVVLDIGAGDSFTDIYGPKRFGTIIASKFLTLLAKRPLILSPQTIGPFQKEWIKKLSLMAIKGADIVSSRDDLSTQFLKNIGFEKKIIEASDVALRLPFNSNNSEKLDNNANQKIKIGLNVSGLLFNGGYSRKNMFGLHSSYANSIRALIRWLSENPMYDVHLVPHVISNDSEVEDDFRVNQVLSTEFPNITLAPKFTNPSDAKSYISGMDFFAGARMHACIAAFSSGVPVFPMAYSRKFAGLFSSMGYDTIADCTEDSTEEIVTKFRDALENREALRQQTETSLKQGLERLKTYELAVTDCLRGLR